MLEMNVSKKLKFRRKCYAKIAEFIPILHSRQPHYQQFTISLEGNFFRLKRDRFVTLSVDENNHKRHLEIC